MPPERITVTYLAADRVFHRRGIAPPTDAVRARYSLDDAPEFVLYLARSTRTRTCRCCSRVHLRRAGRRARRAARAGRAHTRRLGHAPLPGLPAYIAELGLGDYVRWIGPVAEEDKAALYRAGKRIRLPQPLRRVGLGPLQAMASGTPVVACNVSSNPEVTGDAAFLVGATDAKAMGGAILALLVQPDYARQIANRGLARAREFSWRKTAEGTFAVYTQALAR